MNKTMKFYTILFAFIVGSSNLLFGQTSILKGKKIKPTYEESLRTYNITIDGNKTQTIKRK